MQPRILHNKLMVVCYIHWPCPICWLSWHLISFCLQKRYSYKVSKHDISNLTFYTYHWCRIWKLFEAFLSLTFCSETSFKTYADITWKTRTIQHFFTISIRLSSWSKLVLQFHSLSHFLDMCLCTYRTEIHVLHSPFSNLLFGKNSFC